MTAPIWFMADPHLHENEETYLKEFYRWVDWTIYSGIAELFLMGDLFHYWYLLNSLPEDPLWQVMERLEEVAKDHFPVTLFLGNRDFLIQHTASHFPHIRIFSEPVVLKIGSKFVYFSHGDDLSINDWKYQIYKRVIRSQFVLESYRLLPTVVKQILANRMSEGSYQVKKRKSKKELEITHKDYLGVKIEDEKGNSIHPDVIIHGHLHFKRELQISDEAGTVMVYSIPRWDETGEVLVFNPETDQFTWQRFDFNCTR